jgi:CO/xanthine dehydrogenase Mo-binding subunit
MAKHRGKGIAAIEYPTGMNQNGDPSQAWIKVKPDGRVDVFAGTADIGNGSKTIQTQIVAETIGVPYDWVTYDNSNTDSSPMCTGTFASRATFVAGMAALKAAQEVKVKLLEIAGKELGSILPTSKIIDGEVIAKALHRCPSRTPEQPRSGTATDHGTGAAQAVLDDHRLGKRRVDLPPPPRSRTQAVRPGRWTTDQSGASFSFSSATTSGGRSTHTSRARSKAAR